MSQSSKIELKLCSLPFILSETSHLYQKLQNLSHKSVRSTRSLHQGKSKLNGKVSSVRSFSERQRGSYRHLDTQLLRPQLIGLILWSPKLNTSPKMGPCRRNLQDLFNSDLLSKVEWRLLEALERLGGICTAYESQPFPIHCSGCLALPTTPLHVYTVTLSIQ